MREQITGDHNAVQQSCSCLRLSEIGYRIRDELNVSGTVEEKEALLLGFRKARKMDKSACLVCSDVIVIDSMLLACPMYRYYLLLRRMHLSRAGNLWWKAWWLCRTRSMGHSRILRDRRGLKVCSNASEPHWTRNSLRSVLGVI